jgi:hypothetical protein
VSGKGSREERRTTHFVVAGSDDVIGHLGEDVKSGVAFRVRCGLSVNETVSVYSITRVDEEKVDAAMEVLTISAGTMRALKDDVPTTSLLLHASNERVEV